MKAQVRRFISPDVELDSYNPADPDNFSFLLQAIVGPNDGPGEESVQFIVCTPEALKDKVAREGVVLGRPLVIVDSPQVSRILIAIKSAIERTEGSTWQEVGGRLSRLGRYEFEDFVG
ncbi:Imm8 family immunity protein [Kutzneria sp. 744]|uniref:Imm8 family immunity protein n=1 Tax=Kutzneria sp. (strain 744) TaxID=345341 RepID=UPI0003EEA475|nr:Imm8 family immunity protein [Kutzneria sp. 744]EWM14106.1 hypothetical protein KUTG_04410 [Kutzneria sp. 744]